MAAVVGHDDRDGPLMLAGFRAGGFEDAGRFGDGKDASTSSIQ
jgi:hypothetical protein